MDGRRLGASHNRDLLLAVPEAGSPKPGCRRGQVLVRALFLACGRLPSCCVLKRTSEREGKGVCLALLQRALIRSWGPHPDDFLTSPHPNHLPRDSSPNLIASGVRAHVAPAPGGRPEDPAGDVPGWKPVRSRARGTAPTRASCRPGWAGKCARHVHRSYFGSVGLWVILNSPPFLHMCSF